jgi:hypothetical protein
MQFEFQAVILSFLVTVLKWINPKIPGPFLSISTSKMLIYSKKSPKIIILKKNAEIFNSRKIMIDQIYYKNLVKKY